MLEVSVPFHEDLELTCDLTAHSDLIAQGPLNVSWESMGKDVVHYDGQLHVGPLFENRISAQWEDGKLSFTLISVVLSDSDIYECLWQGRRTLSTVMVTVLGKYEQEKTKRGATNPKSDHIRFQLHS